jgi:hypothetical protein
MPFEPQRVHAAAIYCSDGRFGDHIDEFLHDYLGLPNYDRLSVPGGAAWASLRTGATPTQYSILRDELDFLVQAHELSRVVLIAHYGCAYYLRNLGGEPDSCVPHQQQDLREVAEVIRGWYPQMLVECFLARAGGDKVQFEPIPSE